MASPTERVRAYHERTKHQPGRSAAGPNGLDWANQPDPFRTWVDAETVELPLGADAVEAGYDDCFRPGAVEPRPVDLPALATLFELSLGLAAWKSIGPERWALRCNPSSGNLHPTEGYLVCPDLEGLAGGVYHYVSRDHVLEQRARPDPAVWRPAWEALTPGVVVGLSTIHWREAWKYGERAYRYCQLDVGHALAAVSFAAATVGWQARWLPEWRDEDQAQLLGLPESDAKSDAGAERSPEPESPDLLLWVGPEPASPQAAALLAGLQGAAWQGEPNRLSPERRDWEVIPEVALAARVVDEVEESALQWSPDPLPTLAPTGNRGAVQIIRQRRSAQAFDSVTHMSSSDFFRLLDGTLPRAGVPTLSPLCWEPLVHLLLFVHRVDDLAPGLYLLPRRHGVQQRLQQALDSDHHWDKVDAAPEHLPLRRLQQMDLRDLAAALSCRQDIAGDSAFSVGMVAEVETGLDRGPWWYRRLYWEAGAVGQALYLDAEAIGLRGTGIGCFFDDMVHRLIGLPDAHFQSLYHFTVGGPIKDRRLATHPPYAHLKR